MWTRVIAAVAAIVLWLREVYQKRRILFEAELETRKDWDEAKSRIDNVPASQLDDLVRDAVKRRKRVRR